MSEQDTQFKPCDMVRTILPGGPTMEVQGVEGSLIDCWWWTARFEIASAKFRAVILEKVA